MCVCRTFVSIYRVGHHLANIHSIRIDDIVTKAPNRVYVHKVMAHPVQLSKIFVP